MIDIVTVVFREELPILRVQAESVDLYCQDIGIQTIYVVVNDDISIVKEIDPAWWGNLGGCVQILHKDSFGFELVEDGWISQQVLKLLACSLSQNLFSMIVDAKTIFVQEVDLNFLFDKDNRIAFRPLPIKEVFYPAKNIVNELFGIDLQDIGGPTGAPFLVKSQYIKDMLPIIKESTELSFPEWFQQKGLVTEYILCTGYILYKLGTLDLDYAYDSYYSVCNICHSEVNLFDQKLFDMNELNTLTVSIHRNCWKFLTDDQKVQYVKFLESKGIAKAKSIL